MFVSSAKELIEICNKNKITIWEYTLLEEMEKSGLSKIQVVDKMKHNLLLFRNAIKTTM